MADNLSKREHDPFRLQSEIYWYKARLVRIYSPIMTVEGVDYFWICYLDDKDVTVVNSKHLKLADKEVQVLYGS